MITFDKLMLVADMDAIRIIDDTVFEKHYKGDIMSSMRFYQEIPYLLSVKIDYEEREVVIEFTGKILKEEYPKLISKETIEQCFQNINALGFCEVDIDSMMNADVTKCDVTKDIQCDDVPRLTSFIKNHIRNYNSYSCKLARNNNLILEKNVTSRKYKKRMTVYDKGVEMSNAENKRFVSENNLEGAFDGICRFEVNLNCKKQIRDALHVNDTKLITVLSSTATPIADFVKASVQSSPSENYMNDRKTYMTMLVLKDCDYDLQKVEAKMRTLYKRGTKFSEVMTPYREMLDKLNDSNGEDILKELLEKLR